MRERCEASPKLLAHGVDYVLHALLDFAVDNYLPVVNAAVEEVDAIEERLLQGELSRADIERIYELRRELVRLRRVAAPMIELRLRGGTSPGVEGIASVVRQPTLRRNGAPTPIEKPLHQAAALVRPRLSGRLCPAVAAARCHRKSPEKPICSQVSGEVWASSASGTDSPRARRCWMSASAELLRILAAVGDAPLLERADDLGQCVALLAFVQAGVAALSELRRLQPVQHEKGALDTAELLDGQVELVLPLVGGESFQHGQRCHGAGLQ